MEDTKKNEMWGKVMAPLAGFLAIVLVAFLIILKLLESGVIGTVLAMILICVIVAAVFGGTHLVEAGKDRILNTVNVLREMGMETLGLSHCSGDAAEALARDVSGVRVCHLACGDSIFLE